MRTFLLLTVPLSILFVVCLAFVLAFCRAAKMADELLRERREYEAKQDKLKSLLVLAAILVSALPSSAFNLPYRTNAYTFTATATWAGLESLPSAPCSFTNWMGGTNRFQPSVTLAWTNADFFDGFNLYVTGGPAYTNRVSTTNLQYTFLFGGPSLLQVWRFSCIGTLWVAPQITGPWSVTNNPCLLTNGIAPTMFFKGTNVVWGVQ